MINQVVEMLDYAEFLVWVEAVQTGFIDHDEAEEITHGYWVMNYLGPGAGYDRVRAEEMTSTSLKLYSLFLSWRTRIQFGTTKGPV